MSLMRRTTAVWAAAALACASCSSVAQAASTTSTICASANFTSAASTALGGGPVSLRSLVVGDEVCLEFSLASSVSASWFAVGLSRGDTMVSSPEANVMVFRTSVGTPESYSIAGYASSDVSQESAQTSFVVHNSSTSSMSFSYQRTLAASESTDVTIVPSTSMNFIWAYGTSWPIYGHRSGTNGVASYVFAADGASASSSSSTTTSTSIGSSSFYCNDKNCPAIVGGIAFAVMLLCGFVLSFGLRGSAIARFLHHRMIVQPPVKVTKNDLVATPWAMFMQNLADLRIGELLVMLIFVAAVIILIALDSKATKQVTSGQVALLVLMFLVLPVSRVGLWRVLFGASFERIVKFHRWMGMIMTIATIIHVIHAVDVIKMTSSEKYGNVTPVYGAVAFFAFMLMAVLSIEFIRRRFFEVFYVTHRVLSIVGFVFTILHCPKVIGWALLVPLAFYVLGLVGAWASGMTASHQGKLTVHHSSTATSLVLHPTETTLNYAKKMHDGSYFWVRIPSISGWQWHPFSAIVTPEGDSIGFCIKAMGHNSTFTHSLLKEAQLQHEISVNLCGPYGKLSLVVDNYDVVIMVAGGVGITPMLNLINQKRAFPSSSSSIASASWHVLWSVRDEKDLLMTEDFMPSSAYLENDLPVIGLQDADEVVLESNQPFAFHVSWDCHVSTAKTSGSVARTTGDLLSYKCGRPILDEIINNSRFAGKRVAVVACGPPTMTVEAQHLARACNFDFHKEVFNW